MRASKRIPSIAAGPMTAAWTFAGYGWVLLVVYLSLTPSPPSLAFPAMKLGHMLAYAWLMAWFAQVYARPRARLLLAVALCLLGIVLEVLQSLTETRHFSYWDMAIDASGVLVGMALMQTRLDSVLASLEGAVAPKH